MTPYRPLSRSIAGRRALITGAASGMGRATAHLFAREGADVAITDLDQTACEAVAAEIDAARSERGGESIGAALPRALDVGDPVAIAETVPRLARELGGLDILVNNAGFSARTPFDEAEAWEDAWQSCLNVMLSAHQRMVRAALPRLRESDAPRIVNVASTEGLGATRDNGPYAAAKHGVIGLTRALAVDLGREGITVNCICPGPIRTGITDRIPEEHKTIFAKRRT
ncbi:MAG: SDR family NAD(P)-dependent oxidoreductase, partial [Pseudomonadota bacterium]